jgi:hypothetical protein
MDGDMIDKHSIHEVQEVVVTADGTMYYKLPGWHNHLFSSNCFEMVQC